jgi:uncharacterized protein
MTPWRVAKSGLLLDIRVAPGADKTALGQVEPDATGLPRLKIRITAPPVEGAANKAVIAYVAKSLGLAKRDIFLASGAKARSKTLALDGEANDLSARITAWIKDAP